jgi:hypothetical protein
MRLNLNTKDIQIILDALANDDYYQAVLTREKVWAQVKKDSKKVQA